MPSIRARLTKGLLVSLLVALFLLWLFISNSLRAQSEQYVVSRLVHDSETLLASLLIDQNTISLDNKYIGAIYRQAFSGHYFQIESQGVELISRSLWDHRLALEKSLLGLNDAIFYQRGPKGQNLLAILRVYKKAGREFQILVAEDMTQIDAHMKRFNTQFSGVVMLMLFLLVWIQSVIVRRSLRPLEQLKTELKDMQTGEKNALTTILPNEISPLAEEINHLNDTLKAKVTRHRNALSDLAHALKKPLTVIYQLSNEQGQHIDGEIKAKLQKQVEASEYLIKRILNRARLAGSVQIDTVFDFKADINNLLSTLDMMHLNSGLSVEKNIQNNIVFRIDREDMTELLGNLLDNAYKWADKSIKLEITEDDGLHVIVEDDGNGVSEGQLALLTERGARLDEFVDGHGIGLATVQDIVSHYSGSLHLERSCSLGGFKVSVELPVQQK